MDFSGTAILVVGDVMLDRYLAGEVARISPEAPVPVVRLARRWSVPGGAGNVARNLSRLGVDARLAGLVGDDAEGRALREAVSGEGIGDGLTVSRDRSTTSKTRVLGQGQQLLRLTKSVSRRFPPGSFRPCGRASRGFCPAAARSSFRITTRAFSGGARTGPTCAPR